MHWIISDLQPLIPAVTIFLLRTVDVSLGTVRTVVAVRGQAVIAAVVGICEAGCFVLAAGIVFSDLSDPLKIIGYSVGFGCGTALGVTVAGRLQLGSTTVRIVLPTGPVGLADTLASHGFVLNVFDGVGRDGPIRMIVTVIRKRDLGRLLSVVKPWGDQCFVTVGEEPVAPGALQRGATSIADKAGAAPSPLLSAYSQASSS